MESEPVSLIIRLWQETTCDSMSIKVTSLDTETQVPLREGVFLLYLVADEERLVHRCIIRHLASGQETHLHGSARLVEFITGCLLESH